MKRQSTWCRIVEALLFVLPAALTAFSQRDGDERMQTLLDDAKSAQSRGDFDLALTDYKQAVALRPNLAELWANLGLMEHQCGRTQEAIVSFKKALSLKASLFVPNLFLGIDSMQMKRSKDAIPYLERAEKLNGKDAQAPLALGRAYASLNDANRAAQAYRRVIKLDPGNSDAWFGLGLMSLEQVENDTRQLVRDSRGSPYLQLLTGEALGDEGRPGESVAAYRAALTGPAVTDCGLSEYGFALLRIEDLSGANSAFDASSASKCPLAGLGIARVELEEQSPDQALQQISRLWKTNREIINVNIERIWNGLSDGQLDAIQSSMKQAANIGSIPPDLAHFLELSIEEAKTIPAGSSSPAIERGDHSTSLVSHSIHEAEYAFYAGDYENTCDFARRLALVPSTRAAGLYWEIRANQKLAVASLTEAARTSPDSPKVHVMIGDTYRQRQRYEEAEAEYKKALALMPNEPGALLGLAADYFMENKFDDALSLDALALKGGPDDPKANLLAAEILVSRQAFADAEPHLKLSLHGEPELLPRVHVLLGDCFEAKNDAVGAIREMEMASRNDEDGTVHYKLARLYRKIGDINRATTAMQESKKLHDEHRFRATIPIVNDPLQVRTEPPDQ
jgi:tetratricopeptide (TPR) repeat protein